MGNNCTTNKAEHHETNPQKPNKQCPRCGTWFHCSHSGKCWCVAYQLSPRAHAMLEEQYSDCLCENCLRQYEHI
ncbi:MAG: cysteine-rich CWC family protein [Bacteroidales bacterium]|nr:cysteine-rich CWC family protein [Bacteroidales bacterium]MDD3663648.1 cysteine-rich CWC family protein [Bacteroidales bacterium]